METLNLSHLAKHFSDETAARRLLEKMRWPNGPTCPHCGADSPYRLTPKAGSKTRAGVLKCRKCRKQFTVTVGTIFEDSHVPISKWLLAVHLLCASKKGMSAHQLHRMLGVTYKTAWFMFHRLRHAMTQEPLKTKLRGVIEVDETYVGGKWKWRKNWRRPEKRGRPSFEDDNKTPVVALVQRGGAVRAFPMERVTARNLGAALWQHVDPVNSTLMTDEAGHFTRIGRKFQQHEAVKHAAREYVRGDAHVNTAEGFFATLKRGITGVYHHVGKGHLGAYVDEFTFRYNTREMNDGARTELAVQRAEGKRLFYEQPIRQT
jgi:transposase-like protein